jgi:hypothetical protein
LRPWVNGRLTDPSPATARGADDQEQRVLFP